MSNPTGIKKESNVPSMPTSASAPATTRRSSEDMLKHLIETVLNQPPNSPIHKSLDYEGADTLVDFLNFMDKEIDDYELSDGVKLPKKDKKKLKNLLSFVKYLHKKNNQYRWLDLKPDDLQEFLIDVAPNMSGSYQDSESNAADKFHANVKLDVKQYPTFDGELSHWLKFKRNVLALAATHRLMDIFNEDFIIPKRQRS